MRILFCKISWMKYYKGHSQLDIPANGGKYVLNNGFGHEEFNFKPIKLDDSSFDECIGYVEPKSNKTGTNTFHIEKISGCSQLKNEPFVEDVLVVWCATRPKPQKGTTVVGWYKNACVWRKTQKWNMPGENGTEERLFNVRAKAEDCVLLPEGERNRFQWSIPSARGTGVGFGQAMLWNPNEENSGTVLERVIKGITDYRGENWLNKFPE